MRPFVLFALGLFASLWPLGSARAQTPSPASVGGPPTIADPNAPPLRPGQPPVEEVPPPPPKVKRPCRLCPLFRGGFATLDPTALVTSRDDIGRGFGFDVALGLRIYVLALGAEGGWQNHAQRSNPEGEGSTRTHVNVFFGSVWGGLRTPPIGLVSPVGLIAGLDAGYTWPSVVDDGPRGPVDLASGPFLEPLLVLALLPKIRPGLDFEGPMGAPGLGVSYRRYIANDTLSSMLLVTVGVY
jgi:hypothetical protein